MADIHQETLTQKIGEPNDNVVTGCWPRTCKNAISLSLLAWVAMLIYYDSLRDYAVAVRR
ncbi:MAG: hypothetical protein ACLSA6_18220 [Holdemania massiliensis]